MGYDGVGWGGDGVGWEGRGGDVPQGLKIWSSKS